jgi:hypothetical protein
MTRAQRWTLASSVLGSASVHLDATLAEPAA